MRKVRLRAAARRDLVEHFVYLAENAGLETAERFLSNAETSFNDLASRPLIGASLALRRPELGGIRKWRLKGVRQLPLSSTCRGKRASPSCAFFMAPLTGGVFSA